MEPLLTVDEVANLLHISKKTVYAHSYTLGGFYPLGIQVLRFKAGDIHERLEGAGRAEVFYFVSVHVETLT